MLSTATARGAPGAAPPSVLAVPFLLMLGEGVRENGQKVALNSKTMLMDKLCCAAVCAVIGSSVSPVCPASCPMRGCPSRAPTFSIPVAPCTLHTLGGASPSSP